ncbi:MAG: transaldolase [Actinomycetota bacterium]
MVRRSRLRDLSDLGQSVWIDYLSRDLLETGELARLIQADAVVGVTSNPTIFEKAISGGSAYDVQLSELVGRERESKEIFYELAARDIAAACDLLLPVWETTGGLDGYVSWEVDPNLAGDREASVEEAQRLHAWIDRPNLYVKLPATVAGVGAIEDMVTAGKNINVTLIFSLRRHEEVVEAYIRGLERFVAEGGDPAEVHSVASFFVSRVDTESDTRLSAIGGHDELEGKLGIANAKLGIANAKLAYQSYLEAFSGPRWDRLAAKGATRQRCLWASTSTKNPAYADVMHVEGLIGPETVNTMPAETIRAFQDHGRVAETLTQGVDEARRLLAELERAGIDAGDVVLTLEQAGVAKFVDSFATLLHGVEAKRGAMVASHG